MKTVLAALATTGGAATTDAPGSARPPVEQNRIDPAAPSRQRLQIDEGASARAVQNPGANVANPSTTGNSFNTIIEGSPSNNGTSTGVSGTAPSSTGSGALTSPSGSVTPSASPSGTIGVPAAERRALLVAHPQAADLQAVVLPAVAVAAATRLQAARIEKGTVHEFAICSIDICRPGRCYSGDGANEHRTVRTASDARARYHRHRSGEPCQSRGHRQAEPGEQERCNGAAEGSQRKQQRRKRNIWSVQSDTQPRHRSRPAVKA